MKNSDEFCIGYGLEFYGFSYNNKEIFIIMGFILNDIDYLMEFMDVDFFVDENVFGCEDFVDVFADETKKLDKIAEVNIII